jgi:ATP-dependent Lhr-like helicase
MVVDGMSMRADIVPPDKITRIIVESAKARILNETRTLACLTKKDHVKTHRIKELPERIECPRCGSTELGIFDRSIDEVYRELGKEKPGAKKTGERWWERGKDASKLISMYGRRGAIVATAKRVDFTEAWDLLAETEGESEEFYERVVDAERNALKRGFR